MQETMMETPAPQQNKNTMLLMIGVAVIVIGAGLVIARSMANNSTTPEPAVTTQTEMMEQDAMATPDVMSDDTTMNSDVRTITIEAGAYYYNPKEIRVKKGETIKIVMTSKDMMHDFNIDQFNVKMPITKAGDTGTVQFVADTVGEFEYYCSVGNHRSMGQVGKLIVE